MRRIILLFLFALTILSLQNFSSSTHTGKKEICSSLLPLNSDSLSPDFSKLKSYLLDKRIVMLSDGHKDGSSKQIIFRLLKYLHEQCGFDVLLLETNMYGGELLQQEIKNQPDSFYSFAKKHIIGFISKCSQSKKMFEYAQQSLNTNHSLIVSGFDFDIRFDKEFFGNFIHQLDSVIKSNEPIYAASTHYLALSTCLDSFFHNMNYLKSLDFPEMKFDRQLADTICIKLQHIKNDNGYWALAGRNLKKTFYNETRIEKDPYQAELIREDGMWDDLQWLLNEKYAGKKVIVWAAGTHLDDVTKFDKETQKITPLNCGYHLRNSKWKDSIAYFPCLHIGEKEEKGSAGFTFHSEHAHDGLLIFAFMNSSERKKMSRFRYHSKWITGKITDLSEGLILVNGDDECGWE